MRRKKRDLATLTSLDLSAKPSNHGLRLLFGQHCNYEALAKNDQCCFFQSTESKGKNGKNCTSATCTRVVHDFAARLLRERPLSRGRFLFPNGHFLRIAGCTVHQSSFKTLSCISLQEAQFGGIFSDGFSVIENTALYV